MKRLSVKNGVHFQGYTEHVAALEGRKESSMPIRAGIFFDMFPFCILFEKDMIIKNMGGALRNCIPQMVGKKVIVPLVSLYCR